MNTSFSSSNSNWYLGLTYFMFAFLSQKIYTSVKNYLLEGLFTLSKFNKKNNSQISVLFLEEQKMVLVISIQKLMKV